MGGKGGGGWLGIASRSTSKCKSVKMCLCCVIFQHRRKRQGTTLNNKAVQENLELIVSKCLQFVVAVVFVFLTDFNCYKYSLPSSCAEISKGVERVTDRIKNKNKNVTGF